MLGVCLRKLCPQGSFEHAFREKKTVRKSFPGGWKTSPRRSKMASGRPPDGSFVPVRLHLAAKAAGKPSWGGSGGALGALLALLESSWVPPGPLLGPPGPRLGAFWAPLEGPWRPSGRSPRRRCTRTVKLCKAL